MARIYYESLSSQVKKKMKERAYSVDDLELLQERIKERHLEKVQGFKRAALILSIVFVMIIGMTVMSAMRMPGMNMTVIAGTAGFTAIMCVVILVIMKFLIVDRVRNQFIAQVKKYYPEYAEQFTVESFKQERNVIIN